MHNVIFCKKHKSVTNHLNFRVNSLLPSYLTDLITEGSARRRFTMLSVIRLVNQSFKLLINVNLMLEILCLPHLRHLSATTTFFSVEHSAKIITISRINSQKQIYSTKFVLQTLAQNLYCLKNSPLGDASIHCKYLQF